MVSGHAFCARRRQLPGQTAVERRADIAPPGELGMVAIFERGHRLVMRIIGSGQSVPGKVPQSCCKPGIAKPGIAKRVFARRNIAIIIDRAGEGQAPAARPDTGVQGGFGGSKADRHLR